MLKYKCIFQIKLLIFDHTALGNCYGLKLAKCWLQIVLFMTIANCKICFRLNLNLKFVDLDWVNLVDSRTLNGLTQVHYYSKQNQSSTNFTISKSPNRNMSVCIELWRLCRPVTEQTWPLPVLTAPIHRRMARAPGWDSLVLLTTKLTAYFQEDDDWHVCMTTSLIAKLHNHSHQQWQRRNTQYTGEQYGNRHQLTLHANKSC